MQKYSLPLTRLIGNVVCTDVYFENYYKDTYTLPKNGVVNVTAHDSS